MPSNPANQPISSQLQLTSLTVSGPDARAFLQAQLTADLDAMHPDAWSPAAWCTPKGRVLAVMLVLLDADMVRIALPAALARTVRDRMDMFRIGRQVTISEGPAPSPDANGALLAWDSNRKLALADAPSTGSRWNDWLRADIATGMPWILPETADRFLPQMLSLERLDGLSYRKGCYPGQEIVARVRYKGRITQRLARFRVAGAAPTAGDSLDLGEVHGVVLYGAAIDGQAPSAEGLMVVPADADPDPKGRSDAGPGAPRWAIVGAERAVLPSGG